ncbi:hypothetical protein SUGI_0321350 [Cryptomeria japonica]|uniref:protein S40-4-like n=1 Tax=Cryptomeria japonica TaxID=3369 RepID=UPI0024089EED|nr:protein S40-4-like [Cryptomeria japonica]GLJ18180.1 hypothetical protein SUGI_0321350 [Cryptomeria japonica]
MAEIGDRGGREFKSGLSRAEVLLGLAQTAGEQAEETLKELHEQDIFWGDKEDEQNGFESDLFGIVESRSRNCKGKSNWSNIFPHGGKRRGELEAYRSYKSAPVNVPHWPRSKISEDFLDEDDEIIVRPPHELVAHYNNNNNSRSFSVVEGYGRTLKGRDLRRVRDAVFRQTGLLD